MSDGMNMERETGLNEAERLELERLLDGLASGERDSAPAGLSARVFESTRGLMGGGVPADVRVVARGLDRLGEHERAQPERGFEARVASAWSPASTPRLVGGGSPVTVSVRRTSWSAGWRGRLAAAAALVLAAGAGLLVLSQNGGDEGAKPGGDAVAVVEKAQELGDLFGSDLEELSAALAIADPIASLDEFRSEVDRLVSVSASPVEVSDEPL